VDRIFANSRRSTNSHEKSRKAKPFSFIHRTGDLAAIMRRDNKSRLTERQRQLRTRRTRDIGEAATTDEFADAIIGKMH